MSISDSIASNCCFSCTASNSFSSTVFFGKYYNMNCKECNQYKFVNTLDDLQTLQVHLFSDLGKVRKQIIVVKLSSARNLFGILEHQKSFNTVSTVKALFTSSSTCFNEGTSLLSLIHTTKSRISTQQRNLWFFPNTTQTLRTA